MSLSYTALQSKYVPYVVTIDAQNNANFGGLLSQTSGKASPAIVNAFIRRYIENARAIIIDPVAQKQSLAYVYAVSRGEALAFLNSYYPLHDPFTVAKKGTVEVQVQPSLQKSAQTWQTQWTEITRDLNGVILHQAHYEALVTVGQYPFKDATEMNINPLGLYVTHISWSQQL